MSYSIRFVRFAACLSVAFTLAACHSEAITPLAQTNSPSTSSVAQTHKLPDRTNVQYTVKALPTLGGTSGIANGISNDGLVDGDANLSGDTSQHGVVWAGRRKFDLGTLGGPNSVANWPATDRGQAAVNAETSTADPLGEDFCGFGTHLGCGGFVWSRGSIGAPLTPLPGGNNSAPQAMNDRGQVSGYAENGVHDPTCVAPQVLQVEAVIWRSSGKPHELNPYQSDPDSVAFDINDHGDVAGATGDCGNVVSSATAFHAILWQDGSPIYLGSLGGQMNNVALSLNNRGQVVGFSDLQGDAIFHPFIWKKKTGMTDLGVLPGDTFGFSSGVNNWGQAVGQSCDASGNCRGFLWENGTMTDLNTLIPAHSNLQILSGKWINDDGVIVGQAYHQKTGATPAYIAVPSRGATAGGSAQHVVLPKASERVSPRSR